MVYIFGKEGASSNNSIDSLDKKRSITLGDSCKTMNNNELEASIVALMENLKDSPVSGVDLRAERFGQFVSSYQKGGEKTRELEFLSVFGQALTRLRKRRNISRELLSCLINVSREDIFALEHGMLEFEQVKEILLSLEPILLRELLEEYQPKTFLATLKEIP